MINVNTTIPSFAGFQATPHIGVLTDYIASIVGREYLHGMSFYGWEQPLEVHLKDETPPEVIELVPTEIVGYNPLEITIDDWRTSLSADGTDTLYFRVGFPSPDADPITLYVNNEPVVFTPSDSVLELTSLDPMTIYVEVREADAVMRVPACRYRFTAIPV